MANAELEFIIAGYRKTLKVELEELLNDARKDLPELDSLFQEIEANRGIKISFGSELKNKVEKYHGFAKKINPDFQSEVEQFSETAYSLKDKSEFIRGPLKEVSRILEKLVLDKEYDQNPANIKDIIRNKIVIIEDPREKIKKVEEELTEAEFNVIKVNYKNDDLIPYCEIQTYLNFKITVDFRGVQSEIVISTPEMAVATNIEHRIYEIRRTIGQENTPKTKLNDPYYRLRIALSRVSKAFYREAGKHIDKRTELLN